MTRPYYKNPVLANFSKDVDRALQHGPLQGGLSLPTPEIRCPDWWKDSTYQWARKQRETMERGFATLINTSLNGSWETAEQYVYHKDLMMLRYLYNFPRTEWVVPPGVARLAYQRFYARESLRRQGTSIYDKTLSESWWFAEEPVSTIHATHSIGVSPPIETNISSTTASSEPESVKSAEENGHSDFAMQLVFALLEKENSIDNAPPAPENDNHEAPLNADELSQNVSKPVPKRGLDSSVNTPPQEHRKRHKSAHNPSVEDNNEPAIIVGDLPYSKNPVPQCLLDSLSVQVAEKVQSNNDELPWSQRWANDASTDWDDSIYAAEVLIRQKALHQSNSPMVENHEAEMKKEVSASQKADGKRVSRCLEFSDDASRALCRSTITINCSNVDEAIEHILRDRPELIRDKRLSEITIHYGPSTTGLEKFHFSLLDSIRTRMQMSSNHIMSPLEAYRVVDFAPDLTFGIMLVRILTEGTLTNQDLRDRLMLNGCFFTYSTISGRLQTVIGGTASRNFAKENKDEKECIKEAKQWLGLNLRRLKLFRTIHQERVDERKRLLNLRAETGPEEVGEDSIDQEVVEETEEADQLDEQMYEK